MTAALFRMEFGKAFRSKWFVLALAIGCAMALFDAFRYLPTETLNYYPNKYYYPTSQGCYHAWMSINTSSVSLAFYQILPLLAVAPYAWSLASELNDGYANQVYSRASRGKYLVAKYAAAVCSAGAVAVLPQVLNIVALACMYPAYLPDVSVAIYTSVFWKSIGSWLYYNFPLGYVALYCFMDFVLCGLWAGFALLLGCFVRNRVVLLTAPYVVLMIIQFLNDRIVLALGGLRGVQISLIENLYGGAHMYVQDGRVIVGECILLASLSFALFLAAKGRDVLCKEGMS